MPRKEFNFTIGADPEFNIVMQGRRIMAENTIRELFSSEGRSVRQEEMGFKIGNYGEIGWDGNSPTGEIRPTPAKTADELIANIEGIFKSFHEKAPLFNLSTLSYYGSIGGHIHLGLPEAFSTDEKLRGIHKRLASFYLPIMLSENKINLQLRLKIGYGKLSDYRAQNYNDARIPNGYEFRTPSAEWLTTKKIAVSTIAYVATVYNEIINHPTKMKKYTDIFYKTTSQADALQQLALSDYKTLTSGIYNKIKKIIKTFEYYPTYKEEIEYILNPEKVMKDKIKVEYNIIEGWGFKSCKNTKVGIKRRDLTNKKKIKELSKTCNLDTLSQLINISYNDDTNVGLFAKGLAERITMFKWMLKNNYYLFGLKKGIKDFIVFDNKSNLLVGKEQIETTGDLTQTKELAIRMISKFRYDGSNNVDPEKEMIYGKNRSKPKDSIIIGIPYDIRVQNNINPLVSTIYNLEKKKLSSISLNNFSTDGLRNDGIANKNGETVKGEINSAMSEKREENYITYDNSRRSEETVETAVQILRTNQVINEQLVEEEIEENPTTVVSPNIIQGIAPVLTRAQEVVSNYSLVDEPTDDDN